MSGPSTPTRSVAAAWRTDRPYLVDLAYRMLGDVGAAEDVVQEAFLRLSVTPSGEVRDERGWLTVVTSRLCLDQLRSARSRRERPGEAEWLETLRPLGGQPPEDPADRVTLDDEVQAALGVVLARLGPAERVAYVLHDIFQLPFDRIGETLGRPPANCRQLAHRARQKIAREAPGSRFVPVDELRTLAEVFLTACASGDLDALTAILHPAVWGVADFVVGRPPRLRPMRGDRQVQHGAPVVAATLLRYFSSGVTMVTVPAATGLTFLAVAGRRPYAVVNATVDGGQITRLHVVSDPTARPGG